MPDLKAVLERADRAVADVPLRGGIHELERRRDRKRRNQRVMAGSVGLAVFVAAVWFVTTGGPFDRSAGSDQQPASSGADAPAVGPILTDAPAVEPHPAPSAGGSVSTAPWLDVSALPEGDYIVDLDTGATTPLPAAIILTSLGQSDVLPRAQAHYSISPDRTRLAYVGSGEDGSPQIFVAGIDGTGIRQVTNHPVGADWPAWSPDGASIAYEGVVGDYEGVTRDGECVCHDLFVLDLATGGSTQVVDGEVWTSSGVQFTPDGSALVYTGGVPFDQAEMRTVPVAGGQSTILFGGDHRGIGHAGQGALSPDGSLVTFMGHEVGGPGALRFVVNADGTDLRYTRGRHANPAGEWSPDGSRIVALHWDTHIIVVDVVTGDALRVAEGLEAIWLDDHTLLVEV